VNIERKDGILVVTPDSRLDAFNSTKLEKELEAAIKDEDSILVLNMENVQYLSSGGVRVLRMTQKRLKSRGGDAYLCRLTDFTLQVLKMTGVDSFFTTYQAVDEAVRHGVIKENMRRSEAQLQQLDRYTRHDAGFRVFQSTAEPSSLKIVGDLMKVLHATLEPGDIKLRYFSETEYSIGLGALGGCLDDCFRLLGEMITIGGTMVWLPTDGNDTPDFLIPQKDTGEVMIYTGLNSALDGVFNDIVLIEGAGCAAISISDVYDAIFDITRERQVPDRCVVSLALVAELGALFSSGVRISPVKRFTPANAKMITDPENIGRWMDINTQPKHAGRTMVSFGVGLDLGGDLSRFDRRALDNLFYLHPANTGSKKMMLHNHGVVFEHLDWQFRLDLDDEIRRIVRAGEFLDMRHLLDTTTITRAVAGVSYISDIRME